MRRPRPSRAVEPWGKKYLPEISPTPSSMTLIFVMLAFLTWDLQE
jgi:hypothetical protein